MHTNKNYHALLSNLEILKIDDIYRFRLGCMMFRIVNENFFPEILQYISPQTAEHDYTTRNRHLLNLPFPNVENVRMNFKFCQIGIKYHQE